MKTTVIEINNWENEPLKLECPYCKNIVMDDKIQDEDNLFKFIPCPHTFFMAVNEYVEYRTPFFEKIAIENDEDFDFDDIPSSTLAFEDEQLNLKNLKDLIIYEIVDSSSDPFNSYTTVYVGFNSK